MYMDENTYWKRTNRNTGLDKDSGNKTDEFDFKIDLDNYDGETLVPGLRNLIRDEILITKYQDFNRRLTLKYYFDKLKQ